MKKISILALISVMLFMFSGCDSRNMKEELPGEWYVWHWYYNVKDGDNGFFDEAKFYNFNADGELIINENDTVTNAKYEFTSDETVKVTYADGTFDDFQLIPAVHEGVNQIQFMNENTNYTLTLEPMSGWTE
ncbi:MAG: hypothetical protein IKV85_06345 [Ruminococcus sp.]|nr:hypothetical protein [Ruminococcus sp.]